MSPAISKFAWLPLLFIIGISGVNADPTGKYWTVSEISGTASIESAAGKQLNAQTGSQLDPAFTVLTGADGHVVISHGQDRLTVGPDSRSTVALPKQTESGIITRIKQALGSVLYQVEHRVNGGFEVDTPYLVSVVKGTTFNINVTRDASTVSLVEGRLLVYTPDKTSELMLTPGQAAIKSIKTKGIMLKDQQSLSEPVQGRITIVKDGETPATARAAAAGAVPATAVNVNRSLATDVGTLSGVKQSSEAVSVGGASDRSLVDVGASLPGVSTTANVGSVGASTIGTSVSGVSTNVGIGGGNTVDLGVSTPVASTSINVSGTGAVDLGASVPAASTSVNVGSASTVNVGTTVPGVSTSSNIGTGSGVDLSASVPAVSTSTSVSAGSGVDVSTSTSGTSTATSLGSTITNITTTVTSPLNLLGK